MLAHVGLDVPRNRLEVDILCSLILSGRYGVHLLGTLILLGSVPGCSLDLLQPLIDVVFVALDLLIQVGRPAQIPPAV